ncbi:PQQ-binding-like beta-propeller repeat protein [Treponema sp.]|uniref:outer membrane protein assembly factor BamB family protein n=1 Tax=Treponema sp. TaxID=166 RepID=UPI00298DA3DF|nr:PQQ-binding-like beta-propeller repeat protein [Treponema sp.]MCQ2241460.1 PQQ-binding-like beta-propeller repeat protein [Treponema sp.]
MKRAFVFFTAVILSFYAFSETSFVDKEIDFAQTMATDINVIGGMITCQPVRTSYGYIATGDGKQIYGFTQEGKLLWLRSTKFRLKKFLSVFAEDLVCVVSTDSRVSLLNSSGLNLWTVKCDFVISDEPVQGADGRIFVRGKNTVACYGIKGTQRWETKTPDQNQRIKPAFLSDGSIVVFQAKTQNGKSIGSRISPYGKILEEIVFAGEVTSAVSMKDGIVLSFTDGSAGLMAVENKNTVSKWTIPAGANGMSVPVRVIPDLKNNEIFFIYGSSSRIARVKSGNGEILSEFDSGIGSFDLTYTALTSQGITLTTKAKGCCLRKDGKTLWKVKFDPKKSVKYLFSSDSGYLVLCNSNWSMELYQTRLNVDNIQTSFHESKPKQLKTENIENLMASSYEFGRVLEEEKLQEIYTAFHNGNFGEDEEEYLSLLSMEIKEMARQWNRNRAQGLRDNLYFRENMDYSSRLIEIAGESQIYFCRSELNSMLKNVTDPSLLLLLIKCAGKSGWDPDCQTLETFEYLMNTKKIQPSDKLLLDAIADSTWEICRFMGRPTFYQMGKNILGYMLYPQFSNETRDKAVDVMKKIAASKL